MSDAGTPQKQDAGQSEHLNIKVTDGNNEVFFKIKRTTEFKKLMHAFCERQGKRPNTVRFIFDGHRLNEEQRPSDFDMEDSDVIQVHQEQIGGGAAGTC
ncbi:ubiquitin-related domain-containing protein [Phyllosticta capitalensis]|uniref:Ubiquitin-related domain-containing protein n=1 Tax=Phyllosticta capitalensis TaxID=121624 RepID=A0ABR1YQJ7_9PEZI